MDSTSASDLTKRNKEVIQRFIDSVRDRADGVLLSGSNAWGADYAVTEKSDIDLLVLAKDIQGMKKIIDCYISNKLLVPREQERFEAFSALYEEGRVEQFSVIADYKGVPVSIDFFTTKTLQWISFLTSKNTVLLNGVRVRVVSELRTNPPKAFGYSLDDLQSSKKLTYHPVFEEIKSQKGNVCGYLAQTAVDASDEHTYYLGVMSFFLCVSPVVLLDKNGELQRAIRDLRTNISILLKGEVPRHVTREERMSEQVLEEVKNALSPKGA